MQRHRHITAMIALTALLAISFIGTGKVRKTTIVSEPPRMSAADSIAAAEALRDSLRLAELDSSFNGISNLYRNIQIAKTEGMAYDSLYPMVYECYTSIIDLMPRLGEEREMNLAASRNILVSIDPDLEAGAYYYSSKDNQPQVYKFARAYLDIQLMPEFSDKKFRREPNNFAVISYVAATDAYNKQEYDKAIEYFKLFFTTGVTEQRENVYLFMGQACMNTKRYPLAIVTLAEGMKLYPQNTLIPRLGLKACIDGNEADYMQQFLTKALETNPNDPQLLEIQGKLYEDELEFKKALDVFNRIEEITPNRLENAKHIALCYYNIAVDYFNKSVNAEKESVAEKQRRQSKTYFNTAALKLEEVLGSDPMAVRYLRALGICYLCIEEKHRFDLINQRLAALGEDVLEDMYLPPTMSYSEKNSGRNFDRSIEGGDLPYPTTGGDNMASNKNLPNMSIKPEEVPSFQTFAQDYIKNALNKWVQKGEFENDKKYADRVNDRTIEAEYKRLNIEAQHKYLETYSKYLKISDIKLQRYDATNETFLITTSYGPVTLHVPLKNNEAEKFKQQWESRRFRSPRYMIEDDKVRIASLTIVTPEGKSYTYDSKKDLVYSPTVVRLDLASILSSVNTEAEEVSKTSDGGGKKQMSVTRMSDVDVDIPINRQNNYNTFALIIANENYDNVPKVQSAIHDGEIFAEYCSKTLGIPKTNIIFIKDATSGRIDGEIYNLQNIVKAYSNKEKEPANIIFYYAGHGMPGNSDKECYMMPKDAIPTLNKTCIPMNYIYESLGDTGAASAVFFIDACFSGVTREGEDMKKERSALIDVKESILKGNSWLLTATSNKQTAHPYPEKNHGLFTYFLLKKLQESKGNATLDEISDYVKSNVSLRSNLINKANQTPDSKASGTMVNKQHSHKLRR